jgi:1,4-alpha-glucan branching enzyme
MKKFLLGWAGGVLAAAVLASEDIATTFTYRDAAAKSVGVAGEFSNWKVVALDKTDGGIWAKKVYLKPGFYAYKFVINDTDWVLDPANPTRKVVNDIENSGIAVGGAVPTPPPAGGAPGATLFQFRAPDAQSVHLAGSFNNWLDNDQGKVTGHEQWLLQKDESGTWRIQAPIPPGRHEFKFVINGGARWETDPTRPLAPNGNSVVEVVAGGVEFTLTEPAATSVVVAGEFNNWSVTANPLTKDASGKWRTTLPLKPGRYSYKFVVDGNWKTDPANPETAPDGLGGQNSVKIVP